ncbi:MAG: hypothetical protein R3C68_02360 [Myxococcota bacterium]
MLQIVQGLSVLMALNSTPPGVNIIKGATGTSLAVSLHPDPIHLPSKETLTTEQLIEVLAPRIRPIAITSQSLLAKSGLDGFTLRVEGVHNAIVFELNQSDAKGLLRHHLSTLDRSAYDIAHSIALLVAARLQTTQLALATSVHKNDSPEKLGVAMAPPRHLRAYLETQGSVALLLPAGQVVEGLSLGARIHLGSWLTSAVSATLWSQLHANGENYRLRARPIALRVTTGIGATHTRWQWGIDGGATLRLILEQRRGNAVSSSNRVYLGWGLVTQAYAAWLISDRLGVGMTLGITRYIHFQRFKAGSDNILNTGSIALESSIAAFFRL